jgi:streptogramin lyase
MASVSPFPRRAALAAALFAPVLLTACGGSGAAGGTTDRTAGAPAAASSSPSAAPAAPATPTASEVSAAPSPDGSRCHTSDLRASVGRNDPGAGQANHPIVLTNVSERTCTLFGFPGAAFVDASGKQLGPDPERVRESSTRVTLAPGAAAWAGLSYANPEISGARTATPVALLVTPPDERRPLRVPWTAGEVPVGGNESSVSLTVVRAGTGP